MKGALLSEYAPIRNSSVEARLGTAELGMRVTVAFFLLTCLVLVAGHLSAANAVQIKYDLALKAIDDSAGADRFQSLGAVSFIYGYLTELNHGFYYLVVAPFFVYAGFKFFESVEKAFESMMGSRLVQKTGQTAEGPDFSQVLSEKNHRLFGFERVIPRLAIAFVIFAYPVLNTITLFQTADGPNPVKGLGHLEAAFAGRQQQYLQTGTTEQIYANIPASFLKSQIETSLLQGLQSIKNRLPKEWSEFIHFKGGVPSPVPSDIPGYLDSPENLKIDFRGAAAQHLFLLKPRVVGGPRSCLQQIMFGVFLLGTWIIEGFLTFYVIILTFKVMFWIHRVFHLLPPGEQSGAFILRPLIHDKTERYGLQELHRPYNLGMLLIMLGGLVFAFSYVSKTAVFAGLPGNVRFFHGTFAILLLVILAMIAYLTGPIWHFGRRLRKLKAEELLRLDDVLRAKANDQELLLAALEKKELVRAQAAWPKNDVWFHQLIWISFGFILVPWVLSLQWMPKEWEQHLSILQKIWTMMQWVCERMYF